MPIEPSFAAGRPARPLGTFFRWEIPSEGISVHLNLRIIELMERDAAQAGSRPVAGVLLGRAQRGRDLTLAIEHYEIATLDGQALDSPFADTHLADSILERWRPGRSRMSILGLYRTTATEASVSPDDFAALAKVFETDGTANAKSAGGQYSQRPTPILEDPDQIFLMIGPRTERISKAKLYLLRKGAILSESPQIPFDRTELAKLGGMGQPKPREQRPSSTPEPKFSTKDVPSPAAVATPLPEPKREREPQKEKRKKLQLPALPGHDLQIPNWMWPLLAVPVVALGIAVFYWTHPKSQPTGQLLSTSSEASTTSVLGLKLDRSGSSWKLSWNENASVVQGAARGRLLITDGGVHRTLDLDDSDLHGGTIIYTPVTGDVVLQLQVDSPNTETPVSETVRVLGGVMPPLESPQSADVLRVPSNSTASGGIGAVTSGVPQSAMNTPPVSSSPAPAYTPPPTPPPAHSAPAPYVPQPLNSTQVARNFPSYSTPAPQGQQPYVYKGLTPQPTAPSGPTVASEMPEPYRSLMRGNPALTQPLAAPKPASVPAALPAPYRAVPTASRPSKLPPEASQSKTLNPYAALYPNAKSAKPGEAIKPALPNAKPIKNPAISPKSAPTETSLAAKAGDSNGGVETAELISRTDPEYPAKARETGVAGNVEVHFRIGKDGQVYDVTVVSGAAPLAQAAVAAVLKWRYKPAQVDGVASDSDANAVFSFKQN